MRFTERLEEIGSRPSLRTVADSYDNASAETTDGLYKTEWNCSSPEHCGGGRAPLV